MLDFNERSHKMSEIRSLTCLLDIYAIDCQITDVTAIVANIKSVLKFESQRVALIQEVNASSGGDVKKEIKGYFQQAIEVMKDDRLFYKEYCRFIKRMPKRGDMTMLVYEEVYGELHGLIEGSSGKDTSKTL